MAGKTLYQKVWDQHRVKTLVDGRDQVFIGLHLVHEVTSPQAFGMLKEKGLAVSGKKADLIARLKASIGEDGD